MVNKLSNNPFLTNVDSAAKKTHSRLEQVINKVLETQSRSAFKVMVCEEFTFDKEVRIEQRLLFVQAPPASGWNQLAVFKALAAFRSGNFAITARDKIDIFLGSTRLNDSTDFEQPHIAA